VRKHTIGLMSGSVVGRDAELASIRDFVAGISDGATALVLEGEAGMGKTTLWTRGGDEGEARGVCVLRARPGESEGSLSFSGVRDLLDPVLDDAFEPLPGPQRRALSRALLLDDDAGPPTDPHAIGVALLGVFRGLAAAGPVLLAIDDVQWLDAASSGSLAYALRRLHSEPVGTLLARRSALDSALLSELRRSLPTERLAQVDVGSLDVGALHLVVHQHLGMALPKPLLAEVHAAAGGNPFYALEIVRMLRRSGVVSIEAGHPLPVPETLHQLVHGRLLALPEESRDFLLAAAAHAHPTVSVTEAASRVSREDGLRPALEARVVELERERIRFTHPLLAAGAYEVADPLLRLEVHARLAELLEDPEARAWQLAASTTEPDEEVAGTLEEAAWHARARGAPRPAALLLDRACELTPVNRREEAVRRTVDAAYLHFEAGDSPRAEAQLQGVLDELAAGRARARALVRLAKVRSYRAVNEAAELFIQAVAEADDELEILAFAHEGAATCLWRLYERLDEALEHADLAARLALESGDEGVAAEALSTRLQAELLLGRDEAARTAEQALALQPLVGGRRVVTQPRAAIAMDYLDCIGQLEQARDELTALLMLASELGDESSSPFLLAHLSLVQSELGELAAAGARAIEGQEASEQSGQLAILAFNLACESLATAREGREASAREAAQRALALARETAGRQAEVVAAHALGELELALGNAGAAIESTESALAFVVRAAIAEPCEIGFVVDHVEALVELGRRDEATELLDWYEGNARRLERVSALANCARCRGLLAAQAGQLESALSAFEEALDWHAKVELPLDRGRTLLALGATLRRSKRRREARETLDEAVAVFERIGAALWAERARAELKRISGRAATPGALTPAEERVAALVAEGKTNKEVGAALFLSDRTVEGHLAHIFGKLGIRHRAELAGALQTRGIATPNTGDMPVSADRSAP
jgi:DNA-binding CsgD family transcriptional regulator